MSSEETDNPHFVFVPPILDLLKHSYSPKLTFTTSEVEVRCGLTRSKGEEKAQRASDTEKKLTCTPAGVISPGTQLCADDKGSLREEMG
jgi:hypothetical protein